MVQIKNLSTQNESTNLVRKNNGYQEKFKILYCYCMINILIEIRLDFVVVIVAIISWCV